MELMKPLLEHGPLGLLAAVVVYVVFLAFTKGMNVSIKTGTRKE